MLIDNRQGSLLLVFAILVGLIGLTVAFIALSVNSTRLAGAQQNNAIAFALAEAGINKAIWNLETIVANGGQGENWTTGGLTESLGNGTYTMAVERLDFASASYGATVTASSEDGSNVAANAIDGNDSTYWQSAGKPNKGVPEEIIIHFPKTLTLNKVRFYLSAGDQEFRPRNYSWRISTDGVIFTTVVNMINNDNTDVTDEFTAVSNVNYLKLVITKTGHGSGPDGVIISTLEAIGARITSTGTINNINRNLRLEVVMDDATVTAYGEKNFKEF